MDKLIINNSNLNSKNLSINKDCYVVIDEDASANNFELNIIDCRVIIIDRSNIINKKLNIINSEAMFVEIVDAESSKSLEICNNNSSIEYNIIDLSNNNVDYTLKEEIIKESSDTKINIACICYKGKNKNYLINTSNLKFNTINEINCFGIVKDDSVLKYDVNSYIKNGSKKSIVRQSSSILLFDEESIGKNNPVLVIEENDVKASHGSSIGKIDDDTMFYMCSRGLSKNEATNLICLGKIEYLINKIEDSSIREKLINKFKERMN